MNTWIVAAGLAAGIAAELVPIEPVHASPESDAADRLLAEGVELAEREDFAMACERFSAARAIRDDVRAQGLEAGCNEKLGKLATALRGYAHLRVLADAAADPESAAIATANVARLETRVGHLTLEVRDSDATTTIALDGMPLPRTEWGRPQPIDAGDHQIRAVSASRSAGAVQLAVADGESVRRWLIAPAAARPSARRTVAFAALGAAALGLAGGVWFGLDAMRTWRNARTTGCRDDGTCATPAGTDLLRDAHRSADIATWTTGIAAGIGGAGVILLATDHRREQPRAWTITPFGDAGISFVGVLP